MNRPRNRQPRPARDNNPKPASSNHVSRSNGNVPSIQQVVRGASVSIVLKEDQATGDEVQGLVQDVLTKGNHPRGIKVRLQDGRVGRVQRMIAVAPSPSEGLAPVAMQARPPRRSYKMVQDVRNEPDYTADPPLRSLADYLPNLDGDVGTDNQLKSTSTSTCPICGQFEGDEIAVSRHVDRHFVEE